MTLLESSGSGTNDVVPLVHPPRKDVTEVNGPDAIVDLLEADGMLLQGVGDEQQALLEPESSGVGVRIGVDAVPRPEVALEIGRPEVVGLPSGGRHHPGVSVVAAPTTLDLPLIR